MKLTITICCLEVDVGGENKKNKFCTTQALLAKSLGCTPEHFSNVISGHLPVSKKLAVSLQKKTNYPISDFLTDKAPARRKFIRKYIKDQRRQDLLSRSI